MLREKKTTIVGIILGMMIVTLLVGCLTGKKKGFPPKAGERQQTADLKMKKKIRKTVQKPLPEKSKEAKQAVMDADLAQMDVLELYYDDNHLSLVNTVKAYLKEFGIGESQIAFSYKDLNSGRTAAMNDHQPMIAGSTYKLPLNMLVVDKANYP